MASEKNGSEDITVASTAKAPGTLAKDEDAAGVQSSGEQLSSDAQPGVQKIEATTLVWTRTHLVVAYIMIWSIYLVNSAQQSTTANLTPYVTSSFSQHRLTATTQVMSQLIGGLSKLTLAKILDIWGRPQGYLLCVVLLTVGLVMMAACRDVETYAAAQVFFWLGFNNLGYSLTVFTADTSELKDRSLMFAFVTSPYIITAWVGGPIAKSLLAGPGFRWGFGIFAIATPVITMPLFFLFWHNYRKACRRGLIARREANRTVVQSLVYYVIEFDALGLVLVTGGLALFLLPFNTTPADPQSWTSARVLSMLVGGLVLLVAFIIWERFFAPVTFMPYKLLTDRTIVGACVLAASLFVSYFIWTSFFQSFLQVALDLSLTEASYVGNVYSVGSCLFSLLVAWLIRRTGRFKWLALYFGVPVTALGVGLMMAFRDPDAASIGLMIMCEMLVAFAGGTLVICEQMAVMAVVTHQHVATVLALEAMFSAVGGAVGSTVASAIWSAVFPASLRKYLPADAQSNFSDIYGNLDTQKSYPVASPTRNAINAAYSDAQKNMLIAATAIHVVSFAAVIMWRDIKVKDTRQVKGVVA